MVPGGRGETADGDRTESTDQVTGRSDQNHGNFCLDRLCMAGIRGKLNITYIEHWQVFWWRPLLLGAHALCSAV